MGTFKVLSRELCGLKAANSGSSKIAAGLEKQVKPGMEQLEGGIQKVTQTTPQFVAGSDGLTKGMKAFILKHPELSKDVEFMTLIGTSDAILKG